MKIDFKKMISGTALFCAVLACTAADAVKIDTPPARPVIQIAILLDSSGSMEGLIDQARTYIWQAVSDCALAKKDGVRPKIEVALYGYGHSEIGDGDYITRLSPLTDDLDLISDKLFKLHADGGNEYCGEVIMRAADELAWSNDKKSVKMIFIAGNEPFTQGPVEYSDACKKAISKGVTVTTILCGDETEVDDWKNGAKLADGDFFKLNHNEVILEIATPFDKDIATLSSKLNTTYIPFGQRGEEKKNNQFAQDDNAKKLNLTAFQSRNSMKASKNAYNNSSWDLVDANREKDFDLAKVKEADLPENMRKMTLSERGKYIADKAAEREKIRAEMLSMIKKQQDFIVAERKNKTAVKDDLGEMMINTTRKQAEKQGLIYDK